MGPMPTRLVHLVVDAADPAGLARFWSGTLAWPVTFEEPDEVVIEPPDDDPARPASCRSCLCRSLNPRRPRTACISMWPRPRTSTRRRWLLGWRAGRPADRHRSTDDVSWVVMADPEGNEFCVVSHLGSVGKDLRLGSRDRAGGRGRVRLHGPRGDRSVLGCGDRVACARTGRFRCLAPRQPRWRPTSTCTASANPRRQAACTWTSHPSPMTTTAPRSQVSALSAPSRRHRPRRRPLDRPYRPRGQRVLRPHPR